jgi:predicted ribosomally synthesized peptide with nif11-like leader
MSKADIIKFTKDIKNDATLAAEFKQAGVTNISSAVQFAQDKGYDFTVDEVKLHASEQIGTQTLSDGKMDALLGASWVYSGPTATVEAVAAQTTVAAQAEVAVEEAAAAATTVLAAAEVVIVVT